MSTTSYDVTTAHRTPRTPKAIGGVQHHADAQGVDHLCDDGGPDGSVRVVVHDARTVEQTGHRTRGRASLLGAAAGAWVGLLVGMLLALPTLGPVSPLLFLGPLTVGALSGAVLGSAGTRAGRGRRDVDPAPEGVLAGSPEVAVPARSVEVVDG